MWTIRFPEPTVVFVDERGLEPRVYVVGRPRLPAGAGVAPVPPRYTRALALRPARQPVAARPKPSTRKRTGNSNSLLSGTDAPGAEPPPRSCSAAPTPGAIRAIPDAGRTRTP